MSRVTASAIFFALTLVGVSSAQTPVLGAEVLVADASDMRRCRILGNCSRVSPNLRGQGRQFEHVSDATVCREATGGNSDMAGNIEPYGWSPLGAGWVQEAQRRGLTCGVRYSERNTVPANIRGNRLENDEDRRICRMATRNGRWEQDPSFRWAIREAYKQGLACGVPDENPFLAIEIARKAEEEAARKKEEAARKIAEEARRKASEEAQRRAVEEAAKEAARLAAIDPVELCGKAINSTNGDWDLRDDWRSYSDEAKRRKLTCEDQKAAVRQQLAAAQEEKKRQQEAERRRREEAAAAKRKAELVELQTKPLSLDLAEEVALTLPFKVSLVPQMNDLMLCVQGRFRNNDMLTAEIDKRGLRCERLLELLR